jgi:hypothetical protein
MCEAASRKRDTAHPMLDTVGIKGFTLRFLLSEWCHVVDAWQIADVEAYAKVPRLGRKNRMSAGQRERLWPVFVAVRAPLAKRGLATWADINGRVAAHYAPREVKPFTQIVVRRSVARAAASRPRSTSRPTSTAIRSISARAADTIVGGLSLGDDDS